MRFSTSAILLIITSFYLYGQSGDFRMGSRSMALGYASGNITDEWSGFNNIGAIAAGPQSASVCFAYQSIYTLRKFGKKAAAILFPYRKIDGCINFFSFGDDYYNETVISAGIGHKIRFVSLGLRINYYQLVIAGFGTRGVFYFDAGGTAEIIPGLKIGASIQNINQVKISAVTGEKFPVEMELTLSYLPQESLLLNLQIDKNSLIKTIYRAGLEYNVHKKLFLRTGISTYPVKNYFGLGFRPAIFIIDYALSFQDYLGFNHQLSLAVLLNHK